MMGLVVLSEECERRVQRVRKNHRENMVKFLDLLEVSSPLLSVSSLYKFEPQHEIQRYANYHIFCRGCH